MAKRKFSLGLKIVYDAPATLSFVFICIALFILDNLVFKQKISGFLMSPTVSNGHLPFNPTKIGTYFRLISYSFGAASSTALIINMIFVLLMGPTMEERYGTVVIAIMMFVSALFAGVLNSCFCRYQLTGCEAIVFMMILLNSFLSLSKKKIPLSFVMIFILFILKDNLERNANGSIGIIINIAGGLCGSLFAFLTSPKARTAKKEGGLLNRANAYAEADSKPKTKASLFNRKKNSDATMENSFINNNSSTGNESETVVGSIKFDD